MANRKRLVLTFAYICTHPKDWKQASWRCSTGMCFAGHATVTILGSEPVVPQKMLNDEFVSINDWGDLLLKPRYATNARPLAEQIYVKNRNTDIPEELKPLLTRKTASMADEAREYLGLTVDQADDLFHAGNGLVDLAADIAEFVGVEQADIVAEAKQVAKEKGWRWPRKELRETYGVSW